MAPVEVRGYNAKVPVAPGVPGKVTIMRRVKAKIYQVMLDKHPLYSLELTLWGNPSAASHDEERGLCTDGEAKQMFEETGVHESCPVERTTTPFLTLPTSCTGEPLTTTMSADATSITRISKVTPTRCGVFFQNGLPSGTS